ncbi:unnamed protein product [Linum tenue]|uniref:BHLH domain-containing protein n=1 Tax=Linum tenue TaxID=586396 RepID=A0AAV0GWS4_9ROSI|nr:unnamed protein product [Linum tenue]
MDRASFLPPPPDFHYADSAALLDPAAAKWHHHPYHYHDAEQQQQQRLQYNFHQQQQEVGSLGDDYMGCVLNGFHGDGGDGGLGEVVEMSRSPSSSIQLKPDPGFFANGWPDFAPVGNHVYGISRTSSCPPTAAESSSPPAMETPAAASVVDGSKKRKLDKPQQRSPKVVAVDENGESKTKKVKAGCGDGGDKKSSVSSSSSSSKNKNKSVKKENSGGDSSSKENNSSKVTHEVQKTDYIHVRARRGQATDSHSLAERVRREKISERMKYLQDLVPGCNKITGKAGMLDEIINYVQSLQRQVEFLSMKLAAVNPGMDFNIDSLFPKEAVASGGNNFPAMGMSSSSSDMAAAYLHLNSLQQQLLGCSGLDMGMTADLGLRRTISAPITNPETETFIDSSCFPLQQQASIWDADLPSLYQVAFDQARAASFPSQQFAGTERGKKMETLKRSSS